VGGKSPYRQGGEPASNCRKGNVSLVTRGSKPRRAIGKMKKENCKNLPKMGETHGPVFFFGVKGRKTALVIVQGVKSGQYKEKQ